MWNRKAKVIAVLAGVAVTGTIGAATAAQAVGGWSAMKPGIERVHAAGAWHGRHGHGGGRHFAQVCDEEARQAWIDARLDLVESFADFEPEQARAWARLTGAIRSVAERVGAACVRIEDTGPAERAPEGLARAETFMATGLAIVQEVRPAFDEFYGTLDEEQQRALDRVMTRWH